MGSGVTAQAARGQLSRAGARLHLPGSFLSVAGAEASGTPRRSRSSWPGCFLEEPRSEMQSLAAHSFWLLKRSRRSEARLQGPAHLHLYASTAFPARGP